MCMEMTVERSDNRLSLATRAKELALEREQIDVAEKELCERRRRLIEEERLLQVGRSGLLALIGIECISEPSDSQYRSTTRL